MLLRLGPSALCLWSLSCLAFIAGTLVAMSMLRRRPGPTGDAGDTVYSSAAIFGSRFVYILLNLSITWRRPLQLFRRRRSLSFTAGVVGLLAGSWFALKHRAPFWPCGCVAPSIALGRPSQNGVFPEWLLLRNPY